MLALKKKKKKFHGQGESELSNVQINVPID